MDDLISRQAAIDALSTPHGILYPIRTIENIPSAQPEPDTRLYSDGFDDGYKQAIKDAQPSFSQPHENDRSAEPCEDVVSRKAVEEMLKNGLPTRGMWEIEGDVVKQTVCETLADALMDLEKLPSVTPKEQLEPCGDAITIDWLTNYMNGMIVGSDRWWGVKWMLEDWAKSRENKKNHDT